MKTKALQKFKDEDIILEATHEQIIDFLENFRTLHEQPQKKPSKLISIKIKPELLNAFKLKAIQEGVPYQTKIKELMQHYLCQSPNKLEK